MIIGLACRASKSLVIVCGHRNISCWVWSCTIEEGEISMSNAKVDSNFCHRSLVHVITAYSAQ